MAIRGRLGADPVGQHHLNPQGAGLQKSLLKPSKSNCWNWQPASVLGGPRTSGASWEQFLFTEKFIIKLLLGLKVTAWICLQMSTGIRGKLGTVLGRHYHQDLPESIFYYQFNKNIYIHKFESNWRPPGSCFAEKYTTNKLLLRLKVSACTCICFLRSSCVRGKPGLFMGNSTIWIHFSFTEKFIVIDILSTLLAILSTFYKCLFVP